jgi:hypothetical protein
MSSLLTPLEGLQEQTSAESLVWQVDVTGFTATAAAPVVSKVVKVSDETNVASTVMPTGSPTVSAGIISLPVLKLLTVGERYRIHLAFTDGGSNTYEAIVEITCPI